MESRQLSDVRGLPAESVGATGSETTESAIPLPSLGVAAVFGHVRWLITSPGQFISGARRPRL